MAAAGSLTCFSPLVERRTELGQRWSSRSVGGVGCDVHCRKSARIPPINRRLSKLSSASFGSVSTSGRRLVSSAPKVQIQDSQNLDTGIEELKTIIQEVGTSHGVEERKEGWDLSWLPSFPYVITAAMANFMFGFHIGVINGPLNSIAKELHFDGNTLVEGFVVSIFIVGAFIGSISGGILSDAIGRRRTFQICATPLVIGAALSASADSVEAMVLGRLLVGVGIGVNTALVPLYISEIAPTKFRGTFGGFCQIGTCSGIIAALVLGIPSETDPHWWRTMFWLATIPGALLVTGMQFCVESPRWLGKMGRWNEASLTIEKLWGKDKVEDAMEALRNANSAQEEEASWSELFTRRYMKVVGIGGSLFAFQQFAGINGVLYFSSSNFHDAGITNTIAASAVVGVANVIGALVASSLMDSQGRRKMLMGSYAGMATSLAMMVSALNIPMDEQLSHGMTVVGTLMYVFTFALGAGPVMTVLIPEMCSTRIRAKAMAFSLCVHWVCNFGIGLLFLEMVERFGLSAVYSSFGIVSLISILFSNSFIIETKGRSLEEIELLLSSEAKQS
ncbi:unnamed protein product [Calypogeia fissa]